MFNEVPHFDLQCMEWITVRTYRYTADLILFRLLLKLCQLLDSVQLRCSIYRRTRTNNHFAQWILLYCLLFGDLSSKHCAFSSHWIPANCYTLLFWPNQNILHSLSPTASFVGLFNSDLPPWNSWWSWFYW